MQINTITGYSNQNKYQHQQSFGHIVVGEQTLKEAKGYYNYQFQKLSEHQFNLKRILNYDKATENKKKIMDSVFEKMPKEEVEDFTLYGEMSTKPLPYSRHLQDVKLTAKYPEEMLVFTHMGLFTYFNSYDYDFSRDEVKARHNKCVLSQEGEDILPLSSPDSLPIPKIEAIEKSIANTFYNKYIEPQKTFLKLPTREEVLKKLVFNTIYGKKYDTAEIIADAIDYTKPMLEKLSENCNIELRPVKYPNFYIIGTSSIYKDLYPSYQKLDNIYPWDTAESVACNLYYKAKNVTECVKEFEEKRSNELKYY